MKSNVQLNRRNFLQTTLTAAAAPLLLPTHGWSADSAPSGRLTMGFIGLGTQGRGLMRGFLGRETRVLAVCDVDTTRRTDAKGIVDKHYGNNDCAACTDFREVIARTDIDAVCIATPDHWHAIPMLTALRAGKDTESAR